MEAVVLGSADEVLFASDGARARAIARLPDLASRSQTILTGYDAADFAGVPGGSAPQNTLEIIHAGSVLLNHMGATLDRLIEALVGWSTADSSVASTVRFRFVGGEPELERRFKRAGVGSWVQVEPAVSRRALAQRLRRAQVALALASPARYGEDPIPGKIFDAVGAGLPVFAMTPEGSLADLVRRRSLGVAIDPGDPGAIVHHLSELRTRILRGETIEGPPESSRHALSNERAVERAIAAMCDVRKRAIHRRNRRCPSPSVS